jgi:hypothetical protein
MVRVSGNGARTSRRQGFVCGAAGPYGPYVTRRDGTAVEPGCLVGMEVQATTGPRSHTRLRLWPSRGSVSRPGELGPRPDQPGTGASLIERGHTRPAHQATRRAGQKSSRRRTATMSAPNVRPERTEEAAGRPRRKCDTGCGGLRTLRQRQSVFGAGGLRYSAQVTQASATVVRAAKRPPASRPPCAGARRSPQPLAAAARSAAPQVGWDGLAAPPRRHAARCHEDRCREDRRGEDRRGEDRRPRRPGLPRRQSGAYVWFARIWDSDMWVLDLNLSVPAAWTGGRSRTCLMTAAPGPESRGYGHPRPAPQTPVHRHRHRHRQWCRRPSRVIGP